MIKDKYGEYKEGDVTVENDEIQETIFQDNIGPDDNMQNDKNDNGKPIKSCLYKGTKI